MSYSALISFKSIDLENLFPFLTKFKKTIMENLDNIAEDEFIYSPFCKNYHFEEDDSYEKIVYFDDNALLRMESEYWADRLFKYRWFYNNALGLLGIYGAPKCTQELFDGTIYFQNSCDQDYEREDWDNIEVFQKIYDKWQNVSNEVILGLLKEKGYTDDDFKEDESLDYYRRSAAYDEIWELIGNTLFDDDSVTYLSLFGYYDILVRNSFLSKCFDKAKKFFTEEK